MTVAGGSWWAPLQVVDGIEIGHVNRALDDSREKQAMR